MAKTKPHSKIEVAVWWPNEGYGSAEKVKSFAEARRKAEYLQHLGYGKYKQSEIHIIKTTVQKWRFSC
jgi:hypothetical protein